MKVIAYRQQLALHSDLSDKISDQMNSNDTSTNKHACQTICCRTLDDALSALQKSWLGSWNCEQEATTGEYRFLDITFTLLDSLNLTSCWRCHSPWHALCHVLLQAAKQRHRAGYLFCKNCHFLQPSLTLRTQWTSTAANTSLECSLNDSLPVQAYHIVYQIETQKCEGLLRIVEETDWVVKVSSSARTPRSARPPASERTQDCRVIAGLLYPTKGVLSPLNPNTKANKDDKNTGKQVSHVKLERWAEVINVDLRDQSAAVEEMDMTIGSYAATLESDRSNTKSQTKTNWACKGLTGW